jgi:hypothetical protein
MQQVRVSVLVLMVTGAMSLSGQGKGPPRIPGVPLAAWQELHPDKNSASIYFRGDGTKPLTVNTVTTVACNNTRQPCGEYTVDLKVEPGQVVEALQLHRLDEKKSWSFGFLFEAGQQRPGSGAHQPATEDPVVPIEQAAPAYGTTVTRGRCSREVTSTSLPAKHRILQMYFMKDDLASRFAFTRTVTVRFDETGTAYLYDDWRGYPDVAVASRQKGVVAQSIMHSPEPNVSIHFDLPGDSGFIVTSLPTGEISQRVRGPGFLTAESLGRPGEMIARIWKECH